MQESDVEADGFTVEQWLAFDGAGDLRVELVDGAFVVTPAPGRRHQLAVNNLVAVLLATLDRSELTVKATGMGVISPGMRPEQGLIPDALVTTRRRTSTQDAVIEASEAVLAVEVLSPSSRSRDRVRKLDLYARMGIPHYWFIDPRPPITITTLGLVGAAYQVTANASGDDPLRVDVPFAVTLRPSQLADA